MARQEADVTCFEIVQALEPKYWDWTTDECAAISASDTRAIGSIIKSRLEKAGCVITELYIIQHDKDIQNGWDEGAMQSVITYKSHHVHCYVKCSKGLLLGEISYAVGVEPQYINKAKQGRYAWDNMVAYAIHAKEWDKHPYDPHEVVTLAGEDYMSVYTRRKEAWEKGKATKKSKTAKADIDWLEEKILRGEILRNQVILTDEYYEIYARNRRRCDEAFDTYAQRKTYKTIQAMENGEFSLSVIFITGKSHAGKSRFTDFLVENIKKQVLETKGEQWTSCSVAASNPFDEYMGEEILVMDDLRGIALSASDWLKLLDPDRVNIGSARYRNKKIACRVIIINSEKDVLDFFYFMKSGGGDRSEAMDQFIRRIMSRVVVYRVPDTDERRVEIGMMNETEPYRVPSPADRRSEMLTLHHSFDSCDDPYSDKSYQDGLVYLTNEVLKRNKIDVRQEVPDEYTEKAKQAYIENEQKRSHGKEE